MKILDLGCGSFKTAGATGVDVAALPEVDIVHDLNSFPYPVPSDSYDVIILRHVVEHLNDIVGLMSEVHRIGKPGAEVRIVTPHFTSSMSYNDPTHRHHFSLLTFDFFCGGTAHMHVPNASFKVSRRQVRLWRLNDKWSFHPYAMFGLSTFIENHPVLYERFFCFLFPIPEFETHLEIIKSR